MASSADSSANENLSDSESASSNQEEDQHEQSEGDEGDEGDEDVDDEQEESEEDEENEVNEKEEDNSESESGEELVEVKPAVPIKKPSKSAPKKKAPAKKAENVKAKAPKASTTSSSEKHLKMPAAKSSKKLTTKDMIIHAVNDLNERKGSTLPAIKKYLTGNFLATEKRIKMVNSLLKQSNEEGWLIQVSGHGGSSDSRFKLPEEMKKNMKLQAKKMEAKAIKEMDEHNEKKIKEPVKRKQEKKPVNEEVSPAKKKKTAEAPKKKKVTVTNNVQKKRG